MPPRVSSPELVGRAQELSLLLDALERAAEGRFSAVFLAGEPGVGKTRLLDELERRSQARGARALAAECVMLADAGTDRPLGLTERELAVLRLVAVGKTNREIGEHLFMAPKTASVHVARILAKLDVSSRVEAATAAQRLGVVP